MCRCMHVCIYNDCMGALPCESDLEDLVSSYEGGQSGQALFAWTPNTHQQGITSRGPYYPGHLHTQKQTWT